MAALETNHLPWIQRFFLAAWSKKGLVSTLLLPLSWLFIGIAKRRRHSQGLRSVDLPVPIIVVGNINVGGSGKSPVVVALVKALTERGYHPGVISRGYGVDIQKPIEVMPTSLASLAGDEPLMIAKLAHCPVVVCPDRLQAATQLLSNHHCDVIISDDGLQHYRLPRSIEVCLVDQAALGNQRCLPAGPLREPLSRLQCVDYCLSRETLGSTLAQLITGDIIRYVIEPMAWWSVKEQTKRPLKPLPWTSESVIAITSMARGERFFTSLAMLSISYTGHQYADHYPFTLNDFKLYNTTQAGQTSAHKTPILMTMKDAVKCIEFAQPQWWALMIEASLPAIFIDSLINKLQQTPFIDTTKSE